MKAPTTLLTSIFLTLTLGIRSAQAYMPGSNLWEPIGRFFTMIWPSYSGSTAQLIDALLLFFIICMTVVEIGQKTKLPKAAYWGVGIALWIASVVALRGQLLFTNPLFALTGFLILTIVFTKLIQGGFEYLFGKRVRWAQLLVALGISLLAAGSVFANILQDAQQAVTNNFFLDTLLIATTLAIPFIIIGAIALMSALWKRRDKGEGITNSKEQTLYEKLGLQADRQAKKDAKLEEERVHEEKLDEYMKALDDKTTSYVNKMHEMDSQEEQNLQALSSYVQALLENALQFKETITSYERYLGKSKGAWYKTLNPNNKAEGTARVLPPEYYARLETIADQWALRMEEVKKRVEQLVPEEAITKDKETLEKLQKDYESLISAENKIIGKLLKYKEEIDDLQKRADTIAKIEITETKEMYPELKTNFPETKTSFDRLYKYWYDFYQAIHKKGGLREQVNEIHTPLIKEEERINAQLTVLKTHITDFETSHKKSASIIAKMKVYPQQIITKMQTALKSISSSQLAEAVSLLGKFKKDLGIEIENVKHREQLETEFAQQEQEVKQLEEVYQNMFQNELDTFHDLFTKLHGFIVFAEILGTAHKEIQNINDKVTHAGASKEVILSRVDTITKNVEKQAEEYLQSIKSANISSEVTGVMKAVENLSNALKQDVQENIKKSQEQAKNINDKLGGES
ncbi:MAG: hypothetical protein ACMXYD_00110 [Candidatus Woesearchaeota archaeon]